MSTAAVVSRIVHLLEDPNKEWVFDDHTAFLGGSEPRIEIWTSNCPIIDTNTYPVKMNIGLISKWKIWKALKVARTNYWLRKLNTKTEETAE